MIGKLDAIFNIMIKGIKEITLIFITGVFFIYFFGGVDSGKVINSLFIISLASYLLAYGLNLWVLKGNRPNSKYRFIIALVSVVFSLIGALITSEVIIMDYIVVYFVIYLIVWFKSLESIINNSDNESEKRGFSFSIVLFLIFLVVINITNGTSITAEKTKLFFPLYIASSLSYFARNNLKTIYNQKNINSLNKSENIRIINRISTLLVLLLLIFTLTGFFGLSKSVFFNNIIDTIILLIQKTIEIIFYPLVLVVAKIVELINRKFKAAPAPGAQEQLYNEVADKQKRPDSVLQDIPDYKDEIFIILKWGITLLIIGLIIYFIIKTIEKMSITDCKVDEDGEEKEFILSARDIRKGMIKSLRKLTNNVSKVFTKNINSSYKLHGVRRIYIDTITKLNEKGYKFQKHYTPNEYLSTIKDTKYVEAGFKDLTIAYNACRYGKEEHTEEKINYLNKIKNDIYRISRE